MAYSTLKLISKETQIADRIEAFLAGKGSPKRLNGLYPDGDTYVARVPMLIPDHWADKLALAAGASEAQITRNPLFGTSKIVLIGVGQ